MKPFTNAELLAVGEKLKLVLPIEEFVFRKRTETALEITIVKKKKTLPAATGSRKTNEYITDHIVSHRKEFVK